MARTLIIDDDARVLDVLRAMVQALGHEAHGADSGAAGLALIDEAPPDLVIVDLKMRGFSGAEVLDQVRERYPALPVVVLTGNLDPEVEAEMRGRGATGFITKPVHMPELGRQIQNALRGRE